MGVGVAADVAQQRLVIDVAALVDIEGQASASRIASTQDRSAKSRDWPVARSVA